MAKKESKDLEVKGSTEVAVINFEEDEAGGFQDVTAKDFKIPLLRVLQALSPECSDEDDPRYIEGAKAGSIYNISTKEIFDGKKGVNLIPCKFFRRWVQWTAREKGGGYLNEYNIKDPIHLTGKKMEKGTTLELPDGTHLVESGYFPCIMVKDDGSFEQVVISVSSSGFNFSKSWLSEIRSRSMRNAKGRIFTPAFWSHCYNIGSETKKSSQYSWKGFCVNGYELVTDKNLYEQGSEFNRQMDMSMIKLGGENESSQHQQSSLDAEGETAF